MEAEALPSKGYGSIRCEDHGKYIHDQNARKIEDVKFQGTHAQLDPSAQHIEKVTEDQGHKNRIANVFCKDIGKQPPYLSLKDRMLIKAQIGI